MAQVFTATLQTRWQGQQMLMALTYLAGAPVANSSGADTLAEGLGFVDSNGDPLATFAAGTLGEALQTYYSEFATFVSLTVQTEYDPTDFADVVFPSGTTGVRTEVSEQLPTFVAASLRSNRVRTDVRRSFRRIPLFYESDISASVTIAPTVTGLLDTIAERLSENVTGTVGANSNTFSQAILSLERVVEDGKVRYVYPTLESDLIDRLGVGQGYALEQAPTSQVSRKVGKGV